MINFVNYLKEKGYSSSEIMMAVSIKVYGITMTKAIYKFNELYDSRKIDGFPDSSIKILQKFYGKSLNKMKYKTLYKKVLILQKTLTDNPDKDFIKESIEYFLEINQSNINNENGGTKHS